MVCKTHICPVSLHLKTQHQILLPFEHTRKHNKKHICNHVRSTNRKRETHHQPYYCHIKYFSWSMLPHSFTWYLHKIHSFHSIKIRLLSDLTLQSNTKAKFERWYGPITTNVSTDRGFPNKSTWNQGHIIKKGTMVPCGELSSNMKVNECAVAQSTRGVGVPG